MEVIKKWKSTMITVKGLNHIPSRALIGLTRYYSKLEMQSRKLRTDKSTVLMEEYLTKGKKFALIARSVSLPWFSNKARKLKKLG
jgi:hypothetical protein